MLMFKCSHNIYPSNGNFSVGNLEFSARSDLSIVVFSPLSSVLNLVNIDVTEIFTQNSSRIAV